MSTPTTRGSIRPALRSAIPSGSSTTFLLCSSASASGDGAPVGTGVSGNASCGAGPVAAGASVGSAFSGVTGVVAAGASVGSVFASTGAAAAALACGVSVGSVFASAVGRSDDCGSPPCERWSSAADASGGAAPPELGSEFAAGAASAAGAAEAGGRRGVRRRRRPDEDGRVGREGRRCALPLPLEGGSASAAAPPLDEWWWPIAGRSIRETTLATWPGSRSRFGRMFSVSS